MSQRKKDKRRRRAKERAQKRNRQRHQRAPKSLAGDAYRPINLDSAMLALYWLLGRDRT